VVVGPTPGTLPRDIRRMTPRQSAGKFRGYTEPAPEINMAKDATAANQRSILANQRRILANQKRIEANQKKLDKIAGNQKKLDRILANQKAILAKLSR
jgi:hypothetical protein